MTTNGCPQAISYLAIFVFGATLCGEPIFITALVGAEESRPECLLDDQGRQLVPGGYVVIETVRYTPDDFRRMVRMGANFQVIRVPLGKIGGWQNQSLEPEYLERFDTLVRLGKDAGLKTIFKLVVYGIRPFGDQQWDAIWRDSDGAQDTLLAAWSLIWTRYKDEPSVFGYDLLNEPQRGLDRDYDRCQSEQLLPLLRRLTDAMHEISPGKWALYQPLLRKREDQAVPGKNPVVPIREPFGRERVIYAPHLYQMDVTVVGSMLDDFEIQARLSEAPLLLGEWGSPTRATTDGNPTEQARYTKVYRATVNELDKRGIGGIKAWFCGSRKRIPVAGSTNWMTWAIFSDASPTGRVERSYITDVIVRPRPLVVAGRLEDYRFDFATRCFEMTLVPNRKPGGTVVFVPAERHYPLGFRVQIGAALTLTFDPAERQLVTNKTQTMTDRMQAERIHWNDDTQHLTIEEWIDTSQTVAVRVMPLKTD